jgi:hypothetical protein
VGAAQPLRGIENDRKGTPSDQNTTFSIFNLPLSIRAMRAPPSGELKMGNDARFARIENDKWIMENDKTAFLPRHSPFSIRAARWIASPSGFAMTATPRASQ